MLKERKKIDLRRKISGKAVYLQKGSGFDSESRLCVYERYICSEVNLYIFIS